MTSLVRRTVLATTELAATHGRRRCALRPRRKSLLDEYMSVSGDGRPTGVGKGVEGWQTS
jgi:hypothetical protein